MCPRKNRSNPHRHKHFAPAPKKAKKSGCDDSSKRSEFPPPPPHRQRLPRPPSLRRSCKKNCPAANCRRRQNKSGRRRPREKPRPLLSFQFHFRTPGRRNQRSSQRARKFRSKSPQEPPRLPDPTFARGFNPPSRSEKRLFFAKSSARLAACSHSVSRYFSAPRGPAPHHEPLAEVMAVGTGTHDDPSGLSISGKTCAGENGTRTAGYTVGFSSFSANSCGNRSPSGRAQAS